MRWEVELRKVQAELERRVKQVGACCGQAFRGMLWPMRSVLRWKVELRKMQTELDRGVTQVCVCCGQAWARYDRRGVG